MMRKSYKEYKGYKIDFSNNIGQGAFGGVYKGIHQQTNREIAVKKIEKNTQDGETIGKAYVAEIRILKSIKNDNIVQFLDAITTENNYLIVQQFCNGGDLRKRMRAEKTFNEQQVIIFLKDILNGFTSLVENGIIHRDIKPENILISNGKLKIADFGFAKVVLSSSQLNKTNVGTPVYMSYQLLKRQKYTSKCDIWALGVLTYELLFGKLPFFGSNEALLVKDIQKQNLVFPKDVQISNQMRLFVQGCLVVGQGQRFSWREVFSHKIFGNKFVDFIQVFDRDEKKYKDTVNNLIAYIQIHNINMNKLYLKLDLYQNSVLTEEHFKNIFKVIDPEGRIISNFDWMINKLDRNSDNAITLKQFNQFLASTQAQQKDNLVNIRQQLMGKQNQQIVVNTLKKVILKMLERLKQSKISIQNIFNSYAAKESKVISQEKLNKLLRKIDDQAEYGDLKMVYKIFDRDNDGTVNFKDFEETIKILSK